MEKSSFSLLFKCTFNVLGLKKFISNISNFPSNISSGLIEYIGNNVISGKNAASNASVAILNEAKAAPNVAAVKKNVTIPDPPIVVKTDPINPPIPATIVPIPPVITVITTIAATAAKSPINKLKSCVAKFNVPFALVPTIALCIKSIIPSPNVIIKLTIGSINFPPCIAASPAKSYASACTTLVLIIPPKHENEIHKVIINLNKILFFLNNFI